MSKENKVATIFGVIFFAPLVIFAYRCNKYILDREPLTGGRLFWRQFGWSLLTSIPLVGLIYGLVNVDEICETRARVRAL